MGLSFFTDYEGEDIAESMLETTARHRESQGETFAFPMGQFDDIGLTLEAIAEKFHATDFVRQLRLMGHGTENMCGFGEHYYSSEYFKEHYQTGLYTSYIADGATIYLEGCDVAKGEAGMGFLKEMGRIFFGDNKTGYLKGNTCPVQSSP